MSQAGGITHTVNSKLPPLASLNLSAQLSAGGTRYDFRIPGHLRASIDDIIKVHTKFWLERIKIWSLKYVCKIWSASM